MKTTTLDLTTPAGRAAFAQMSTRHKRGRTTRPDIPAAPRQAATGLGPLLARGWSVESPDSLRYRLYKINEGLDTGMQSSEKAACDVAKGMERR